MADREEASTVLRIRVASSTCGAGQGNASTMLGQLLGSVLLAIRCVPEVGSAGDGSSEARRALSSMARPDIGLTIARGRREHSPGPASGESRERATRARTA